MSKPPEWSPFRADEQASNAFIRSPEEYMATENHPRVKFKAVLYVTCSAEEDGGHDEHSLAETLSALLEGAGLTVEVKDVQVWDAEVVADRE